MKIYLTGSSSKIKILTYSKMPLVRFTLNTSKETINCIIATHSLNFLADATENTRMTLFGHMNHKKQFVVEKYSILGTPETLWHVTHSIYPSRVKSP